MKKINLLLLFLMAGFISNAQDNNAWTLQRCVDHALVNSLDVQSSELQLQTSEVNYKDTKYDLLPTFNVGGGTGFNWGRTIDPTTNLFRTDRTYTANAGANLGLSLFGGMRKQNTIKQSQYNYLSQQNNLQTTKNNVLLTVVANYTNVVFNMELLKTAELQLKNTQEQVAIMEKRAAAGAVAKTELLNLQATLASNEVSVVTQENNYALSVLQLKQALQIPTEETFEVVIPEISLVRDDVLDKSADDVFKEAEMVMPEIKSVDYSVQSAEYGVKVAKAAYYPTLTASLNINTYYSDRAKTLFRTGVLENVTFPDPENPTSNIQAYEQLKYSQVHDNDYFLPVQREITELQDVSFNQQVNDNIGRSLSVNLNIPIFNGFNARTSKQRATIQKQQAEITAQKQRNTLRQSIEQAMNDVKAAEKSYESLQKQLEAREEAFRVMKLRQENGSANATDFQIAQNDLLRAQSDFLRAKYDYIFKLKILDFYQGKPIEF